MDHDLVIRGGSVVDGTGAPPFVADVGVRAGVVTAIGPGLRGDDELDASGCLVAPGFLDLHTHYDPQVLWDPWLTPSCHQGVTTVVAGNCGFSVAPCAPESRQSMMRTLELVEDMRYPTLQAGIEWDFATYPEYLDRVGRQGTAINFGGYVGHTAVRLWVMGDDAYERESTPAELAAMRAVVAEALRAGAVGFSTDRSPFHRGDGGRPVPSAVATQAEVEALMAVTAEVGRGIVHCAPGEGFHWLYDFQPRLGRPVTWSAILTYPAGTASKAFWGDKLAAHAEGLARGADVHPQVTSRPVTFRLTLADPTAWGMVPAFTEILGLAPHDRAARYADPGWRARAAAELDAGTWVNPRWDTFAVGESPNTPDLEGAAIEKLAVERGCHPVDVLADVAIGDDLRTRFVVTFANDDPVGVAQILQAEGCVLGLSDAGAHVGQLCDAAMPTDFLSRWVRDRDLMPVERGIRRLTGDLADLLEMPDRGRLREGGAADVVVLDWQRLDPGPVRRVHDFPGGGDRLVCDRPEGVVHVVVNGTPIRRDERTLVGELDHLPGVLAGRTGRTGPGAQPSRDEGARP